MDIRPIRNDEDLAAACAEIERLCGSEPGTPDFDRAEVLITLADAYESEHFPIAPPDPLDAILFRMEQMGLHRKDLEPYIGTRARVYEVLTGKRPLTLRMIRALRDGLGIAGEILLGPRQRTA